MRWIALVLIPLVIGFGPTTPRTAPEVTATIEPQVQLVGTWKLVSAKYGGQPIQFPIGSTHIKHMTPTHFMWATYDQNGTVGRAAGGSYKLQDKEYAETPEYGVGPDFDRIKNKIQTFICEVDGNKWHHNGALSNGVSIEEVWEKVERIAKK